MHYLFNTEIASYLVYKKKIIWENGSYNNVYLPLFIPVFCLHPLANLFGEIIEKNSCGTKYVILCPLLS